MPFIEQDDWVKVHQRIQMLETAIKDIREAARKIHPSFYNGTLAESVKDLDEKIKLSAEEFLQD